VVEIEPTVGYARAASLLNDGNTIHVVGASGPLDFDPTSGDLNSAPIEIWTIDTTGSVPVFHTTTTVTP
jgi:hypothetical protein